MKVLVSPRAERGPGPAADAVARALAGDDGEVVSLLQAGIRNLARPLSAAEVALVREALGGPHTVVGYVCRGAEWKDAGEAEGRGRAIDVLAVADHANLSWLSPLTGPNDDGVGPRFPSMTGVYSPEVVLDRAAAGGMIVGQGLVAGVRDDGHLTLDEARIAGEQAYEAVSSELAPVVIVAAHMGLRIAAAVLIATSEEEETISGRP